MPLKLVTLVHLTEQFRKITVSLVLFFALMIPSAVQLIHTFDGHEHITCNETETHFCKTDIECNICAFEAFSYKNDIDLKSDYSLNLPIFTEIDSYTTAAISSYYYSNKQLRAPPVFS